MAKWIEARIGRKIRPPWGWEYLKRLGYSKRVLRPRHAIADPAAQEAFKKPSRVGDSRAASLPQSHLGTLGHRSTSGRPQTDPAPSLGGERVAPACSSAASLPLALRVC